MTLPKNLLLKVVQYAQNGQYAEIDGIDLDNRLKWKTAFIYADLNTLLPIYNEKKLQSIVAQLGLKSLVNTSSFAAMNRYLASQRPAEMSIYEYAHWLYHHLDEYLGIKQPLRHFILGSKYGEHDDMDMLPGMKSAGVISTDYGPVGISLADYYGEEDPSTLQQYLEENGCTELKTATQQLHLFLNIRPGDLVAVKRRSYPKNGHGVLEIDTLAVVVALNGEVYSYDPVLGHCLSVQFIPYEGPPELHIGGYRSAFQHIVDENYIKVIFGQCAVKNVEDLTRVLNGPMRRAIESLNTTTSTRRAIAECTITREHNKLQERFAAFLREKYGSDKVKLEQNYVDIRLIEENRVTFYEVKKDYRPIRCIREALGQLLEYAYRHQEGNEVRCVVVGPVLANEEDEAYVSFLRSQLQLDFTYVGFP